jgi:CheY-like chemotaxis protein
MAQDYATSLPILVAIPDDWRAMVCGYLKQYGLSVSEASTYESAVACVRHESVRGIIMTSEWAVPTAAGLTRGLFQESEKKIPAIVLVRRDESFHQYFDQYYTLFLPFNPSLAPDDYIRIPFSLEELLHGMRVVHMIE